jgi:TolB-like protein/tetratricopeptide (TPR) repeat protein
VSLVAELKRRNVFRVGTAYAIIAWLLIQAADILLGNFGAPGWVFKSFATLLVLGFPVALFLAWAYEMTPEGVKRAESLGPDYVAAPQAGRRLDLLIVVGLAAVLVVFTVDKLWDSGSPGESREVASGVSATSDPGDASAGVVAQGPMPTVPAATETSIAVLPFANLSPDPEQEFFADGIMEDILTRLSGIGGLRVISRTSVMRYRGTTLSIPQIAAELGVTHVLEGSVRRSGDRVRITGQLIRAQDDAQLWAEGFDRDLADVFAVQTEIAGQIAERLQLRLTERDRRHMAQRGTTNPRAYEAYLRGRATFHRPFSSVAEAGAIRDEALHHFGTALEYDPEYGAAYAGMARARLAFLQMFSSDQAWAQHRKAVELAKRAIELAPDQAAGYVRLGAALRIAGDAPAAREQFERAYELEPDDPDTLTALAQIHHAEGRLLQSIELLRRTLLVEPGVAMHHNMLAQAYEALGEWELARASYRQAWEEISPQPFRLECMILHTYLAEGDFERGRAAFRQLRLAEPPPLGIACAISAGLTLRDREAVEELLEYGRSIGFEGVNPIVVASAKSWVDHDTATIEALLEANERRILEELPRGSASNREANLAVLAQLRGQREAALEHFTRAVEFGYRAAGLRNTTHPSWEAVIEQAGFAGLVDRMEAELAQMRAELAVQDGGPG